MYRQQTMNRGINRWKRVSMSLSRPVIIWCHLNSSGNNNSRANAQRSDLIWSDLVWYNLIGLAENWCSKLSLLFIVSSLSPLFSFVLAFLLVIIWLQLELTMIRCAMMLHVAQTSACSRLSNNLKVQIKHNYNCLLQWAGSEVVVE